MYWYVHTHLHGYLHIIHRKLLVVIATFREITELRMAKLNELEEEVEVMTSSSIDHTHTHTIEVGIYCVIYLMNLP